MRFDTLRTVSRPGASVAALAICAPAMADEADAADDAGTIVVTGTRANFNNNVTTPIMLDLQNPITSTLALIDNFPGVSAQEGDTFGFDDWSTTIALRGFQTNLDEQQIGIIIEGLPNGGSNYGGGAKANRYIDNQNIGEVLVSQGTADIGSLSNEALGGTLDFRTSDPLPVLAIDGKIDVAKALSSPAGTLAWKGKFNLPISPDTWDGYPWARESLYTLGGFPLQIEPETL